MSGDPEQEYFSDGIAEDIITELSRNRLLFVIARNSSFTYKGHAVDVRQVGRELGVRYVARGQRASRSASGSASSRSSSMRKRATTSGPNVTIVIWSISSRCRTRSQLRSAGARTGDFRGRAAARAAKTARNLSAWEAYQRGLSHWSVPGDRNVAGELLRRAVTLRPSICAAPTRCWHCAIFWSIVLTGLPSLEGLRLAEAEARTALELDRESAIAHAALAWVLCVGMRLRRRWTRRTWRSRSTRTTPGYHAHQGAYPCASPAGPLRGASILGHRFAA